MDVNGLRLLLQDTPFAPRIDEFQRSARHTIHLNRRIMEDERIPIGATKLGGQPDLPPNFTWPERDGVPHAFLAQIRLEDVGPYDVEGLLPHAGRLYFFYGIAHEAAGFDPQDRGSWLVAYDDGHVSTLVRTAPPSELVAISDDWGLNEGLFTACALDAAHELTLPDRYSEHATGLAGHDEAIYEEVVEAARREGERPLHQLLGYPALVQNDMELECQLASNGVFMGDGTWHNDPRSAELMAGESDWLLLLQVDTDTDADLQWGDEARLYYWIQRQALANNDFSNVWFVYQSS